MDINDLLVYLLSPIGQVALIVAIAEAIKTAGFKKKLIPVIDIGLGLASGIFVYGIYGQLGIIRGVAVGLALGLSACGLFSGIKNLIQHGKEGETDDE